MAAHIHHTRAPPAGAARAVKRTTGPALPQQRSLVQCQAQSTASTSAQGQAFRLSNGSSSRVAGVRSAPSASPPAPGSWLDAVPSWASGAVVGLAVAMLYNKLTNARPPPQQQESRAARAPQQASGRQQQRGKDAFTDVMKNVNTTSMPGLSEEQIHAARARRQKERANHKLQLEDIEIPANHPWAVRAPDSNQVRAPPPPRRLRVQRTSDGADGAQTGGAPGGTPARQGRRQMLESSPPSHQHQQHHPHHQGGSRR